MSDTFNWQLKPAPGFPGYQPQPQPQAQSAPRSSKWELLDPPPSRTTVDGRPLMPSGGPPPPDYSNEPYIPSRDRPHTDWGDDDWVMRGARGYPSVLPGPFMPQPREFASLLHGITMGMGRWGSHYSGMPAIAMGTYASAYWKAYQSGMKERAGEAWQQYRQAHQMFLDRQKEELQAARDGYALYGDNPDKLHQYMMGLVSKYHDNALENALAIDPAHVEKLWQFRDSKWQDAGKIKAQQDKERQLQKLRELEIQEKEKRLKGEPRPPEWGPAPSGGGGGATEPESEADSDTEDAESGTTEPATDEGGETATKPAADESAGGGSAAGPTRLAQAETGTMTDAGSGAAPGSGLRAGGPPHIATPEEVNRRIDDYARGELRGEAVPKNIPKDIAARIEARKGDLEKQLEGILGSGAKGQDLLDRVRAFDPQTARTIEDLASGARAVQPGGIGGTQQALWNRLTSIVRAVRPGWGPEVATFRKEFTEANGYSQKVLTNSSSMAEAAKRVLEAMQYIPEDYKPPSNWIDQVVSKKLTGDPRWVNLGTALNVYVEEATRLARSAGGAEGDIRRVLEQYAPMGMGPKAIRSLLSNDAAVAGAQVRAQLKRWQSITGEKSPPLSFDPDAYKDLQTLENIDMMTGHPKPGSPEPADDLKPLLGRSGTRASEKPPTALPADVPKGSWVGTDKKTGKKWIVGPDNKVIRELGP